MFMSLATASLRPNHYNPNQMSSTAFDELVAEVAHLRRCPKPIVVRRDGDGWVIVDGEHGWRAAQEVGLSEVTCEVVDLDGFEAMRQTYKRNQHGQHDPVRLGRMFRLMTADRGCSQRQLASAIGVSEATIRNAVLFAVAADLRNDYAGEGAAAAVEMSSLTVRQVRAYVGRDPNRWTD